MNRFSVRGWLVVLALLILGVPVHAQKPPVLNQVWANLEGKTIEADVTDYNVGSRTVTFTLLSGGMPYEYPLEKLDGRSKLLLLVHPVFINSLVEAEAVSMFAYFRTAALCLLLALVAQIIVPFPGYWVGARLYTGEPGFGRHFGMWMKWWMSGVLFSVLSGLIVATAAAAPGRFEVKVVIAGMLLVALLVLIVMASFKLAMDHHGMNAFEAFLLGLFGYLGSFLFSMLLSSIVMGGFTALYANREANLGWLGPVENWVATNLIFRPLGLL